VITSTITRQARNTLRTNLSILGLLENMGRLVYPDCGKEIHLFSTGGGQRLASQVNVPFLGSLPFDPRIVESADRGQLSHLQPEDSPFLREFAEMVTGLISHITPNRESPGCQIGDKGFGDAGRSYGK